MKKKLLPILAILPLMVTGCQSSDSKDKYMEFDYIYASEPVLATTNSPIFKNIQTEFENKTEGKRITQASIFVSNSADKDKIDTLLYKLQFEINAALDEPLIIKTIMDTMGDNKEQANKFGVNGSIAYRVTSADNGFSLGYESAGEIKDEIGSFVNLLTNNALSNFGDEHIYTPSKTTGEECNYDTSSLKILAPQGAPAVAFYSHATNDNFTTTSNPAMGLIPMFKQNIYDVIVAPTQGGLTQVINQSAEYKIAATITFGNFYLISTGRDTDETLNAGDKVCIFQENDVPGKVFKYLYGDLGLEIYAVAAASDVKLVIENGGKIKL